MPANLENSPVITGLEKSVFIPIPKRGNPKVCSNYRTIALIPHARKVLLKIPQTTLQRYVNQVLLDVQAAFRKGGGTSNQIANIRWIIEKVIELWKNIYFCFINYTKAFDCMDHDKLENYWDVGISDHLICHLRSLYAGQDATVRTGYGTTHRFKLGIGVCQGCILLSCLFSLYSEYIM